MDYSGPSMYIQQRPEESHLGPVPGSIPINNGQMGVRAPVVIGMPETHIVGNHVNYTHNADSNEIPEQHHYNQLPLSNELDEDGRISGVVETTNPDSYPAEENHKVTKEEVIEGTDESLEPEIKTEAEENEMFNEAASTIFLQVSSKEMTLKGAAEKLERPYSYVYRRYQEFLDHITGNDEDPIPEPKRKYVKKNGKKKKRPKRLTAYSTRPRYSGEIYQCEECPVTFYRETQLRHHMKVHNDGNESHPCTACGVVFPKLTKLMRHRMKAHEEALQCPHCSSQFTNIPAYSYHIKTHSEERPYKCDECDKAFYQKSGLQTHKRIHTGERPYMCGYCDKKFITLTKLKLHNQIHTGGTVKSFACEECGQRYAHNSQLQEHMNIHTGKRPYACNMCDARFNFKQILRRHKMLHTGDLPYKCDLCPAAFTLSTDLKRHNNVHTGLKPFKCELCDYACTRKSNLEFHKYTHTGETPFKCDFYGCNAEFSRPKTLKKHKLKHGPPAPKICKVCHEKLPDLTALKRHMMLHTGQKPYTCDQCFKICFDQAALKRHMYKHMYKPFETKTKQVRARKKNPNPNPNPNPNLNLIPNSMPNSIPHSNLNLNQNLNLNTEVKRMGLVAAPAKKWPADEYQVPELTANVQSAHVLHSAPAVTHYAWNTNAEDTNSQPAAPQSFHPFTASQYTNLVNSAWPSAMDPDELRRRLLNSFK